MTATLTIIAGPDAGLSRELLPGCVLVVGRGPDCGLRLSDPGVSRVHCRLITEAGEVRLEDAESRFGTLVNQRPVFVKILRSGDAIEIGDTELRFDCESSLAETMAPRRLRDDGPEWRPEESVTYDVTEPPVAIGNKDRADDLLGTTFVRFQVESLVARTTNGVLYRALDTVHGRPVALKVFWPELFTSDLAMSRFLRAMRAMVPVNHEHLIKLYAAGKSGGLCFTASEFIFGESAAQLIDRIGVAGMLDWRTTWRIAVGLTDALQYLHDRQILHRGLHPGNILIRDGDHCVKLGDSLLAKSLDELGQAALTAHGDVAGDIHYLAPEQFGEGITAGKQADIYSLGATLYALLTGRPPFSGNPMDVVRQILTTAPSPPKQIHLAIPAAFEGIVLRMLSKRPQDRFPDVASLQVELQRFGQYHMGT